MLCDYGCGRESKIQLKNGKNCCAKRPSGCDALKKKNAAGVRSAWAAGKGGYDYSALSQDVKDRMSGTGTVTRALSEVFINGKEWSSEYLRKYIHYYKIFEYKCAGDACGISEWKNLHLTLELDHISGKRDDNRVENLRWLCPNCHSQTPTFRGYNKRNTGKIKITDTELITALKDCGNIRQALQRVGLSAKGGNYDRANKLAADNLLGKCDA